MVFRNERIHLGLEIQYFLAHLRVAEIHERNDVKIGVTDVSGDGVEQVMARKERVQFWDEFGVVVGVDDNVVDEGRCIETTQVLAQKRETFAANRPVFLCLSFSACEFRSHRKTMEHSCLLYTSPSPRDR